MTLHRILIIGSPGAGKSTFARGLAEITGLPLYHIDNLYWNESGEYITRAELIERLDPILRTESWIIDGNYSATFAYRLSFASAVILLDVDFETCKRGIAERTGKPREDIPFVEREVPADLIEAARRYAEHTLPKMLKIINGQPRVKFIHLHSRDDANNYLQKLREGKL
ncbi:MAG: adenylate kinase [Clostridia bacterium]|nr:adenylate kinase [Clostridia bacterium]